MCPCCRGGLEPLWPVRSFDYFRCRGCGSITIDPGLIADIDAGDALPRPYDAAYFAAEDAAAHDRAYGASLARVAEAVLYARTPIRRFLDVGTGHGYLLDALSLHLPSHRDAFFGVERFPPAHHSAHANYIAGGVDAVPGRFEAGCCIEVIEHLTPAQLRTLLGQLATRSHPNALYIVNSGQPEYVLEQDRDYLDPDRRGHIFCYSLGAVAALAEPLGFRTIALRRSWAFLLEYRGADAAPPAARIWSALPENVSLLRDPGRGSVLYYLGLESARAYA